MKPRISCNWIPLCMTDFSLVNDLTSNVEGVDYLKPLLRCAYYEVQKRYKILVRLENGSVFSVSPDN
jgi:hypothetical protein